MIDWVVTINNFDNKRIFLIELPNNKLDDLCNEKLKLLFTKSESFYVQGTSKLITKYPMNIQFESLFSVVNG